MTSRRPGAARTWLRAAGALSFALSAWLAAPGVARANCDVPETPNGIPEEVAFKFDVGGTRAALARSGIGVGGAYFAEPFYNWGGFDQGGEYQGVLELYVNADMNKLGSVERPLLPRQRLSDSRQLDHGREYRQPSCP